MNSVKFNRLLRKLNTDRKAFEEIYSDYYPVIVLHLKRKFGDFVYPEDLAQDLFMKLLESELTERVNYPTAWILKLADNLAIDQLRAQHSEISLCDFEAAPFNVNAVICDDEVKSFLVTLDEVSQKILFMHYWEGYSFKEIAEELKISYGNVRVKVCRAYKKFRGKL